jgi:ParB family transcriptional regulator, chromosome partitioning protein
MSDQQPTADTNTEVVFVDTIPGRVHDSSFRDFSRGSSRAMSNGDIHAQADLPDGTTAPATGYGLLSELLLDESHQALVERVIEREADVRAQRTTLGPNTVGVEKPMTDLEVWQQPVLGTVIAGNSLASDQALPSNGVLPESHVGATVIPLDAIEFRNAYRVVLSTDEDERLELDVAQRGVINPITVAALGGGRFKTVIGDRRVRAARASGYVSIPSRIVEMNRLDELMLLIAEDVNHQAFDVLELSRLAVDVVDAATGASVDELKKCLHRGSHKGAGDVPRSSGDQNILMALESVLGKLQISSQTFRRDYLPLLDAPGDVQLAVQSGLKHNLALQIIRVSDEADRAVMIDDARRGLLSVRQAKSIVAAQKSNSTRATCQSSTANAERTPAIPARETAFCFAVTGSQIDQVILVQPNLANHPAVLAVRAAITNLLFQLEVTKNV